MPSPIKVSLGQFEVDLAELVGVIRDLTTVKLDQPAKDALQALVAEARKSFDSVVDVVDAALRAQHARQSESRVSDALRQLQEHLFEECE